VEEPVRVVRAMLASLTCVCVAIQMHRWRFRRRLANRCT
jgi:hypothetical protein